MRRVLVVKNGATVVGKHPIVGDTIPGQVLNEIKSSLEAMFPGMTVSEVVEGQPDWLPEN